MSQSNRAKSKQKKKPSNSQANVSSNEKKVAVAPEASLENREQASASRANTSKEKQVSWTSKASASTTRRVPRRKKQQIPWLWIGLGVFVVLVLAFVIYRRPEPIEGLIRYGTLSSNHVEGPVTYAQVPPAGGDHHPTWMRCDVYSEPIPNERAVHSLEHGAVWITYSPDLDETQLNLLRATVRSQSYLLLSPYEGLPAPIVATAWGLQIHLDSADDPRLTQFIRNYRQGPQTLEPGAAC
jgi:Protein of unknown function (DUF3105).